MQLMSRRPLKISSFDGARDHMRWPFGGQAANASAKAFSPGVPFSDAMMAWRQPEIAVTVGTGSSEADQEEAEALGLKLSS
jgi:hypothetical protein